MNRSFSRLQAALRAGSPEKNIRGDAEKYSGDTEKEHPRDPD